jgi:hypothetical protein
MRLKPTEVDKIIKGLNEWSDLPIQYSLYLFGRAIENDLVLLTESGSV